MIDIKVKRLSWVWAGQGEDCGVRGWYILLCPTNEHYRKIKKTCGRRDCPEHWRDWLHGESLAVHERFEEYFIRYKKRRFWQHMVISLRPNAKLPNTRQRREREMRFVYNVLKVCGIKGGVIVAHGKRAHSVKDAHACDDGAHYHIITPHWLDYEMVVNLYEQFGIVIKSLKRRWKTVYKSAEYMLSHCVQPVMETLDLSLAETTDNVYLSCNVRGKVEPLHCALWFGDMAYNKLRISKKHGCDDEIECPLCKKSYPKSQWSIATLKKEPPDRKEMYGYASELDIDEVVPLRSSWMIRR